MYAFVEWIQVYGIVGLIVVAFAESSFFPIPPDVLLIPMLFVHREFALLYALVTTIFSVLGAFLGYFIGKKFGKPILNRFFKREHIKKVEHYFTKYGAWSIGIAGFTPLPYKLFTIAAGTFNVRLPTLTIASIIGRGTRFFLEAFIVIIFGDRAMYYLENYFGIITIIITVACVLAYYIFKYLRSSHKIEGIGIIHTIKSKYNDYYSRLSRYNNYSKGLIGALIAICIVLLLLFLYMFAEKQAWVNLCITHT